MSHSSLQVHQVADWLHSAGGPLYTVPALCAALGEAGDEVVLHALAPLPALAPAGVRTAAYPVSRLLARAGVSGAMRAGLRAAARGGADVLHSHGLWTPPTLYPARAVRGTPCRLVASPRGALDPWAFRYHRGRKRAWWLLWQRDALRAAHCIHATAEMEYEAVRRAGLGNPVAVVPNGQHLPPAGPDRGEAPGPRRLLFLSRVHPKKGVDLLLHVWRRLQDRFPDWELQVVGPDDGGYLPGYRALAGRLGVRRAAFHGEVRGAEKHAAFWGAELYVLPSHGENWGVTVAEALAHGVPAMVSRAAPWSGLETYGCGWWVENSVESLADSLAGALSLPPAELRARGARGREWMARDFSWSRVGEMMHETYLWLARGAARPAWVHG